jgi:hypothetical protein
MQPRSPLPVIFTEKIATSAITRMYAEKLGGADGIGLDYCFR